MNLNMVCQRVLLVGDELELELELLSKYDFYSDRGEAESMWVSG